MFDPQTYTRLRQYAERAADAAEDTGLATPDQLCDALRDLQRAMDLLDGVRADLFTRLNDADAYTGDGASSMVGWARQELRMGVDEARRHRRAGNTLRSLPKVAAALAAGRIRAAHVDEFGIGIVKVGADIIADLQDVLLPVAETCEPKDLRKVVNELNDIINCDERDKAYQRGLDRRDLKVAKCGDGYHLSGMLDHVVGAKLAGWLKSVSKAEYDGDDRTPSDRRIDALDRMLNEQNTPPAQPTGGPADDPANQGHVEQPKPRRRADVSLLILADLETLLRLPGARPGRLVGYGTIGTQLLGYLTCGADVSGILTHGSTAGPAPQANVLNVGRTSRLATAAQRKAIQARQDGVCANPGCGSTFLEYHHVAWWDRDNGNTDLANLVGICSRCHHLVHQSKLIIEADGYGGHTFHRATGARIDDHARVTKRRVRDLIARLSHAAESAPPSPARPSRQPRPNHPKRWFDPEWLTPLRTTGRSRAEHRVFEYTAHRT